MVKKRPSVSPGASRTGEPTEPREAPVPPSRERRARTRDDTERAALRDYESSQGRLVRVTGGRALSRPCDGVAGLDAREALLLQQQDDLIEQRVRMLVAQRLGQGVPGSPREPEQFDTVARDSLYINARLACHC